MARKVKISSLGYPNLVFPSGEEVAGQPLDQNALITRMISHWSSAIDLILADKPDLIVMPEMSDRYLCAPTELRLAMRSAMNARMLEAMQKIASQNRCYIAYPSIFPTGDGTWRNAVVMIGRRGEIIGRYNKNYTVISEKEEGILCGVDAPLIKCDFGTVGLLICFDLNFDDLRVKYQGLRPDLLIFPSLYHGGLMQSYWAYSCRSHFVSCVGSVNTPSEIYSPVGNVLATSTNYVPYVTATVNLDCVVAHFDFNQTKFHELKKKYGTEVMIFDPGRLGSVLITSESKNITASKMAIEFNIELLDDYLKRSLDHHRNPANRESVSGAGITG